MTETATPAELQREIDRLRAQLKSRRYGLVWLDVPEGFESDSEGKLPIVQEVPELEIPNSGNQRSHLLIEGDNFHTLTCLNYTHKGKVDVIYIDPPYNTGSDGFRYKDKRVLEQFPDGSLVPKDHPLRHSYWLSFMEKRLRLAKSLLKRNGAIFISINEDEFAQLRMLCDEIFLPSNYMTTFTIRVRHEERILKGDKDFHEVVEYLLMYRASPAYKTVKIERDNTSYEKYVYEVVETKPAATTMTMGNKLVEVFEPGSFEINKVDADPTLLSKTSIRGTLKTGNSSGRFYVKHLEPLQDMKGYLFKVPDMGDDGTGSRYFLTPTKNKNGDYFQGTPLSKSDVKFIPHPNFMDWEFEFNTVGFEGGVQFGGGKKPIEFLKHYLQIGSANKSAVVLDFFAGSGSTGHAVLDLNEEDGGSRQFILATLAEEVVKDQVTQIAEDIARKRFENIKEDYKFGLKYYRNSFVGANNVLNASDADRLELAKNAGDLLALSENTLQLEEATEYFQRYKDEVSERYTAIYFREELVQFEEFTRMVDELQGDVNVYVFTWGNEIDFVDEFTNKNARVKPIPQPILEVYRQIYAQGLSS
jgi:adenine-specific DNA-methyltransferase